MGLGEALGTEMDGREHSSLVTSKRFWMMRQGLTAPLRRGRSGGPALERVIGHCTFMGLASQATWYAFHTCYRDTLSRYLENGPIWDAVLAELLCLRGLLLLLSSSWWLPWNPRALHSDATLHGWALAHSFWPRETVAQVARTLERSRFRQIGARSSLESALVVALLEVKPDGHWRPCENLSHNDEARIGKQKTKLVTHLLDDQHSELNGEREHFLRPPPVQRRVNCFEKSLGHGWLKF